MKRTKPAAAAKGLKSQGIDEALEAAYHAINGLIATANVSGPERSKAVDGLVRIATDACSQLEALYMKDETRSVVEQVALMRSHFPATFTNLTTPEGENWPGHILRNDLQLAPQVLMKPNKPNAKSGPEELVATRNIRYWFGIFSRSIVSPRPLRADIRPQARTKLLADKKNVGLWVEEFVAWIRSGNSWMVESPDGHFYQAADKRMRKLQTSDAKQDIWDGFAQSVRDKIKASVRAL